MKEHISSAYDRDLEGLIMLIMKMGGLVEEAILDAAKSLERQDIELAETVRLKDKAIDALELEVNDVAATVIALRAPVSKDLRVILTVLRLAASLERIGDYAKNIAKRTSALNDMPNSASSNSSLRRMSREVQVMLKDVLDAFVRKDAEIAEDVRQRDQEVDQMYNALFREFLTFMMEDPRQITSCMHLHFMAKNIERMGDLTTNMAEQVIYLVTGEMPEEDRPKSDSTAYLSTLD
ncbi:phosphate signaling complex protein PhoU [Sulfitobacter sp. M57]|uniref:phosphate signaling complex protein PhoU n=1 Tax=unclassified Sulfitobacter TaxID=196795 RepID=UPI0023E1C04C|nr:MULTISPECIES: phosphate signaling complex protein PhoU [unclassified Sulfitobacter]MDF3414641.1 phosphate signaling complex protein PhoU [Sulfitobacter sp. KE5]MDF3422123.1 phosphate signaling complex protein PhoU [Sulfitobacter sp. KE43]MDF3433188.1 phosphate signaling complex protein PhoU [Sulfitobacter sp. KE42]MDF3458828.1 phosphate signaling complex protein PhoU [Sulfitobacter sp. S74]MDF3462727.1 phosphate signaling complex protein PhoU [Sulfitobacter sp. Ks18]